MTSDEERREVARRLRETGDGLGRSALLWYHIAKALGVRTATDGKTACNMLADLIEPSCDRRAEYPIIAFQSCEMAKLCKETRDRRADGEEDPTWHEIDEIEVVLDD